MNRRAFVQALPVVGLSAAGLSTAALTGCDTAGAAGTSGSLEADLTLVQRAAEREQAAIATYGLAARSGLVTDEAVMQAALLFTSHHEAHLTAFNAMLEVNGQPAVVESGPPDERVEGVKNQTDVVRLALTLEFEAAEAYFAQIGYQISQPATRKLFANVYPIEVAHYAQLRAALGVAAIDAPLFEDLNPGA